MISGEDNTSDPAIHRRLASSTELFSLVHRMGCACASHSHHADAPISQELFRRIEGDGQRLVEAARILGLGPKDCAYLLAGLRRDMATELVVLLLDADRPCPFVSNEPSNSKLRNEQSDSSKNQKNSTAANGSLEIDQHKASGSTVSGLKRDN